MSSESIADMLRAPKNSKNHARVRYAPEMRQFFRFLGLTMTIGGHNSYLARYLAHGHTLTEMLETEQLANSDAQEDSPESICAGVAKTFGVRTTEVALLEVNGNVLKFLYPAELKNVGAIPISSSAVAARTARTRRSELFNTFTRVKHSSVFEVIKLSEGGGDVIQKLMTVPILSEKNEVIGVLQVSRKANSPSAAGADFASEDLRKLEGVAIRIGKTLTRS